MNVGVCVWCGHQEKNSVQCKVEWSSDDNTHRVARWTIVMYEKDIEFQETDRL